MQETKSIQTNRTSVTRRVVSTLSRVGIGPQELKDVIVTLRSINTHGMYKDAIPKERRFIYEALARDGVISKTEEDGKTVFVAI